MGGGQEVVNHETASSHQTTGTTEERGKGPEGQEQVSGQDRGARAGMEGQDLQWTRMSSSGHLGLGMLGWQVSIITAYPWVSSHYPFLERSQAG